jgi:general secretion pathway protein C
MKWSTKLSKLKPVPLASAVGSLALSSYFVLTGLGYLGTTPIADAGESKASKPPTRGVAEPSAPARSTLDLSQAILERNMFDSQVGSIAWEDRPAVVESSGQEGEEEGGFEVPAVPLTDCSTDLRLLAAIVADDPTRSFAVMRRGGTPAKQIVVGGDLQGTTLLMLAPTHAYVREPNGVACRAPLFLSTTPPPPVAPAPAPVAAAKPRRSKKAPLFNAAELEAGVTELGPDRYKVSRDMITRGMADAAGVVRGTHFVPQTGSERNAGVKIQDVAETSALHKLGVRSGDVLRTLNGVNLSTPDGMLGAYALLREQKTVTLSVLRDGRPKSITYLFE